MLPECHCFFLFSSFADPNFIFTLFLSLKKGKKKEKKNKRNMLAKKKKVNHAPCGFSEPVLVLNVKEVCRTKRPRETSTKRGSVRKNVTIQYFFRRKVLIAKAKEVGCHPWALRSLRSCWRKSWFVWRGATQRILARFIFPSRKLFPEY